MESKTRMMTSSTKRREKSRKSRNITQNKHETCAPYKSSLIISDKII